MGNSLARAETGPTQEQLERQQALDAATGSVSQRLSNQLNASLNQRITDNVNGISNDALNVAAQGGAANLTAAIEAQQTQNNAALEALALNNRQAADALARASNQQVAGLNAQRTLLGQQTAQRLQGVGDPIPNIRLNDELTLPTPPEFDTVSDNDLRRFLGTPALANDIVDFTFGFTNADLLIPGVFDRPSLFTQGLSVASNVTTTIGGIDGVGHFLRDSQFGIGINQIGNATAHSGSLGSLFDGNFGTSSRAPFLGIGNTADFNVGSLGTVSDVVNSRFFDLTGRAAGVLGPLISAGQAFDHVNLQGNGFDTEGVLLTGKAVTDGVVTGLAAAGALFGAPILVTGAAIYGVGDFALSFAEHTSRDGTRFTGASAAFLGISESVQRSIELTGVDPATTVF